MLPEGPSFISHGRLKTLNQVASTITFQSERFKETLAFAENHRGSFAQDPSLALQRDSLVTRAQAEKTRGASEASDTNDPCSTSLHTQLSKYRMALRKSLSCLKESESLREASQEEIKVLQTTIQAQHEELKVSVSFF